MFPFSLTNLLACAMLVERFANLMLRHLNLVHATALYVGKEQSLHIHAQLPQL